MKKSITIVLILAIFVVVVVVMLFPDGKENADIKHDSRDTTASETIRHVADPQDYSTANSNQQIQNKPAQPYKGQQLEPEIEAAINELVNTSHEGLVEVETNQGVSVDLKGRFRTAPVATINEKGELVVQDYTSAPGR
jgi:hypothetical protein